MDDDMYDNAEDREGFQAKTTMGGKGDMPRCDYNVVNVAADMFKFYSIWSFLFDSQRVILKA